MDENWKSYVLDAECRAIDDRGLRQFLTENQSAPVRLDLAPLRKLPTDLVELLLTAAQSWQKKQLGFELTGVCDASELRLQTLGISNDLLQRGNQA